MVFPANPLETALAGARAGTVPADQLLAALARHQLWVPLPAGATPDGRAQLPVLLLDGKPYVAVYTSAGQYERGAGTQAHMTLTGGQLAGVLADGLGLAVNPGGELSLPVHADGVRTLRGGRRTVHAGTRLKLGEPETEPAELLAALSEELAAEPAVARAWRALAQAGDQPPALLIGVEPDPAVEGWQQRALRAVGAAVARAPLPYPVETVLLDDPTDPVARWMRDHTDPVYTAREPAGG